jgi:hypothetical protein
MSIEKTQIHFNLFISIATDNPTEKKSANVTEIDYENSFTEEL